MVTRKTPDELRRMARAGALLQRLHDHLTRLVAPGVTTRELEAAAQRFIADHGARPSFAGPVEDGTAWFVDPSDGWTVRTHDGSLSVHEEHTVAVTEDGPWVLTASEDEIAQRLSA